jgi:hypothetical protein
MKRFIFLTFVLFIVLGCSSPVPPAPDPVPAVPAAIIPAATIPAPPKPNRHMHNSLWDIVGEAYIYSSRDLTSNDAMVQEMLAHNAAFIDDQWFIIEGDDIPIEEAPNATVYVVDRTTYKQYTVLLDIPRVDLAANKQACHLQCAIYGDAIMFIDKVPPPPAQVVDTRTDFEKYAIYLVTPSVDGIERVGDIQYEFHTTPEMFNSTLGSANLQSRLTGGEVISGRIYPKAN